MATDRGIESDDTITTIRHDGTPLPVTATILPSSDVENENKTVVKIELQQNKPLPVVSAANRMPGRRIPSIWQQCHTIVYHAWLLKIANKTSTILELLLPIIAIGIVLIMPLITGSSSLDPSAHPDLATPNYSYIYTFDPVSINRPSYLENGYFVPVSQLLVAPKSNTTMRIAKNVFQCVLQMAGYSSDSGTPATWSTATPLKTSVTTRVMQPNQTFVSQTRILTTTYVVDDLTVGFDNPEDAVDAINAGYLESSTDWTNQAPVALIFDDAGIQAPSYSLHFRHDASYTGLTYHSSSRLPEASTAVSGCQPPQIGPLSSAQIEQACFASYSNCTGQPFDCQVRFDQQSFHVASPYPCSTDKYIFSGAVALQLCIDTELTRLHANNPSIPMPVVSTRMMPRQIKRVEPKDKNIHTNTFFLMIGCGGFTTICVVWLVMLEKERKLKQFLHMTGVSPTAYWLGWFLGYVSIWAVIGFILWLMLFCTNTSPLNLTDGWMLLLIIYMAGINAIVMAFVFVSLFSRAVLAVMFAVTYIFAIALIYIVLQAYTAAQGCVSNGTYWGLSLLGNYALLVAFGRMLFLNTFKGRTHWSDFGSVPESGGMSIGEAFMMQIFDTFIYALLAYYFDQVIPNEHGTSRHPLFFIRPAFWRALFTCNARISADDSESLRVTKEVVAELNANPDVESVNMTTDVVEHVGIVTQKMCKDFNSNIITGNSTKNLAVDNLSLAIYKNEITAILGHNGAGKTTTIRMLTGQTAPTSGTAYILNHNIHTDEGLRAVQATLGLVTQDNILWPTLTIGQHLQIFGRLKNMTQREIETNSANLLKQLDLLEKINARSGELSGGQKRRLCLALALIGDPQIVFLDEPSCGVDPQSRRKMWDVLNSYKSSDRCIVLTTHSMYEADVLADRKLIVSKGKLRCGGTSVFLKNRFGVGYKLNVELDLQQTVADRQSSIKSLTQQITSIVPSATFPQLWGSNFEQLEVQLPKNEMNRYTNLFTLLESENVAHMGITDIGVSMVSLEEVFLRLSKETDAPKEDSKFGISRTSIGEAGMDQAPKSYCKKFCALLRIRFILWRRRPVRYFVSLAVSILLLFPAAYFEAMLVNTAASYKAADAAHLLTTSHIPVNIQQYENMLFTSPGDPLIIRAPNPDDYNAATQPLSKMGIQYAQLPVSNMYADLVGYGLEQAQSAAFYAGAEIDAWPRAGVTAAKYTVWYNGTFVHGLPLALNVINSMFYKTMTSDQSTSSAAGISMKIYQQSVITPPTLLNNLTNDNSTAAAEAAQASTEANFFQIIIVFIVPFLYTLALSFFASVLVVDAVYDKQTGAIRLLRLSNACGSLYWLPIFVVHIVTYWLPMALAFIIFCNIWSSSFIQSSSITVFTFILHNFLFVLVMTVLAYCASLMFRKASSAMATNMVVSIAVGVCVAITAGVLTSQVVQKFQAGLVERDITEAKITEVLSIVIPWWSYAGGIAAMAGSYAVQSSPSSALVWQPKCWNQMYVAAFIGLVLWLFISLCTLMVAEVLSSGIAQSIMARFMFKSAANARMREQLELDSQPNLFSPDENNIEDDDVRAERLLANKSASVLAEHATFTDSEAQRQPFEQIPAITALHLQKRYGRALPEFAKGFKITGGLLANQYKNSFGAAVRNVSFRVQPKEIFGLLGPNGAGKTTIMAMLVNETRPTAGLIYVDRYNTLINRRQATNLLGYCPQFDALWDEVTVVEHLTLMAALHGQEANMKPPRGLIVRMADKLGLTGEHWKKKTSTLSGGTKRKLSFLISIIDRNMTSLLDEPSSGMDPGSARYLWDIIKHHFKNRPMTNDISVGGILTTHYMEEAEALCDRIAIMMKGTIRCVGTPTHLRNKFGSGYRLELRLVDAQEETRALVIKNIMGQFSEAILKKNESRMNRLVFSVPQLQALPLSKSFAFLESQRAPAQNADLTTTTEAAPSAGTNKVLEYTITQASIEHVFLRIVGGQQDEEGDTETA